MAAERDDRIEALLASISDGLPVDWEEAARGLEPEPRARVEALRAVSSIAEFHRDLQRGAGAGSAPERWGDLLLIERIGRGANAEVFRAWEPQLRREVALKLLHPGGESDALLAEGRVLAGVRHPHVVSVHGIDHRDGRIGLWMELVRGPSLEQAVRAHGPLDAASARRLGLEIGAALRAVHAAGLLHRDVKPANVLRDADGRHVLADFGLGQPADGAGARATSGTPMYMAPERLAGGRASERSDVYALGMVLWYALAGRHPFDAETIEDLQAAARRGAPPLREVRPDVPAALAAVVAGAIAPDPAARTSSMAGMLSALEATSAVKPRGDRRVALAAIAIAATVVLGMFAAWRARRAPVAPPTSAAPTAAAEAAYSVEATFMRRDAGASPPLVSGDRVRPGDRLSLAVRATRSAWFYVLNEDERGERYVLFPQPRFDLRNPLPADSTIVLPGAMGGTESAWTVTSAGGREHFLVVASPRPVPEIEADLERLPGAQPGRPIVYAQVGETTVERLRGVGGVDELPAATARPAAPARAFDRFKALAGREDGVQGVWVRQIVLENPP